MNEASQDMSEQPFNRARAIRGGGLLYMPLIVTEDGDGKVLREATIVDPVSGDVLDLWGNGGGDED